jgi:hypothetical protein
LIAGVQRSFELGGDAAQIDNGLVAANDHLHGNFHGLTLLDPVIVEEGVRVVFAVGDRGDDPSGGGFGQRPKPFHCRADFR